MHLSTTTSRVTLPFLNPGFLPLFTSVGLMRIQHQLIVPLSSLVIALSISFLTIEFVGVGRGVKLHVMNTEY